MRLLLIRHGQTPSNVLGLLDTAVPGPGLTDLGIAQATALPATLADYRIDAIYASTQPRAQLTAEPLATERGLPIRVRAGLREVSAGDLEMLGDDDSIGIYQSTIRQWMAGALDAAIPGGPDGSQVLTRFDEVVAEVVDSLRAESPRAESPRAESPRAESLRADSLRAESLRADSLRAESPRAGSGEDGTAVLFAHGAVLRVWATIRGSDLSTVDGAFGPRHSLHNTGMIVLESTPDGGWTLVTWAGTAIGGPRLDDGAADGPAGAELAGAERAGAQLADLANRSCH